MIFSFSKPLLKVLSSHMVIMSSTHFPFLVYKEYGANKVVIFYNILISVILNSFVTEFNKKYTIYIQGWYLSFDFPWTFSIISVRDSLEIYLKYISFTGSSVLWWWIVKVILNYIISKIHIQWVLYVTKVYW